MRNAAAVRRDPAEVLKAGDLSPAGDRAKPGSRRSTAGDLSPAGDPAKPGSPPPPGSLLSSLAADGQSSAALAG